MSDGAPPPAKESAMSKTTPILTLLLILGPTLVQVGCSKDEDPVEPSIPCSITLNSPVDDTLYSGESVSIRWDKTGSDSQVKIELINGIATSTITPVTPNDGFYPWSVQTYGQPTDDDYFLRVTALGDDSCTDKIGDITIFNLDGCGISFPYSETDSIPNLSVGDVFPIQWTSSNTSSLLRLELWTTSTFPAYTPEEPFWVLADDIADTGEYLWTATAFNHSDNDVYRWRIYDSYLNNDCYETSYYFRMFDNALCTIQVRGVNDGHTYMPGDLISLYFIFENSSGVVDLRLYSGNIPVTDGVICNNFDTQNGIIMFEWLVNDFDHLGPVFDRFNIWAWDSNNEYCVGQSSHFAIAQ